MFTDYVLKWLDNALDYGISEQEFWNMTLAELERAIQSKKRVQKREAQEKASFDYKLADLIGTSIGRLYSKTSHMPEIAEVFPNLFDNEEIGKEKQKQRDMASVIRFKQFVQAHNSKFKKEVGK